MLRDNALRVSCILEEWSKFRIVAWEPTFEMFVPC